MFSKRINIAFILPNLLPGGAERVFSIISQNLDKNKFKVTLVIIGHTKDASFDIKNIDVVFLERNRVSKGVLKLLFQLFKINPDIVITANGHLNTLIAYLSFFFPKTCFIAREVTIQTQMKSTFYKNSRKIDIKGILSKNRFKYFDKIICQSKDMLDDIKNTYKVRGNKLLVINNPISESFKLKREVVNNGPIKFITVGRLSKEKGHLRLLKILSKISFQFHYTIIGNGPEKDKIKKHIQKYNLVEKITLIDFTDDVESFLAKSDLFLQGSFYEGFPNALLESCAVGTPVIGFNVPGGSKEIIKNGINGFLVESEEEFFEKIDVDKKWDPKVISESVHSRFSKAKIIDQYEELFLNTLKMKKG